MLTLDEIYKSNDQGYELMSLFDSFFQAKRFEEANYLLQTIDLDKIENLRTIAVIISWVRENERNKGELPCWQSMYEKIYIKMVRRVGKEKTKRLLWWVLRDLPYLYDIFWE